MPFLKVEATNEGRIGMIATIYFYDMNGQQVHITTDKIETNMNQRLSNDTLKGMLGQNNLYAPYYDKSTGKGFVIIEIPNNVASFKIIGWSNFDYGKPYNIYVYNGYNEIYLIKENAPNGRIDIVSMNIENYIHVSYFLLKDKNGLYSNKEGHLIKLEDNVLTRDVFKEYGSHGITGIDLSLIELPFEIVHYSDVEKRVEAKIYNKNKMHDPARKEYNKAGKIKIQMKDIPSTAKTCRIYLLSGKSSISFKGSLYNDEINTFPLNIKEVNDGYFIDLDFEDAPFTTTHKRTTENPFTLIIEMGSGEDSYLAAYSYSWD